MSIITNYMRFGSTTVRVYDGDHLIKYHLQYTKFRLFDDNSEAIWITDRCKASLGLRPLDEDESPRVCKRVYRKLMSESVRLSCCPSVHLSRAVGCKPKTDRKSPSVGNLTLISVHPFLIKYIFFSRRSIK